MLRVEIPILGNSFVRNRCRGAPVEESNKRYLMQSIGRNEILLFDNQLR